jgi:hypothetical protein
MISHDLVPGRPRRFGTAATRKLLPRVGIARMLLGDNLHDAGDVGVHGHGQEHGIGQGESRARSCASDDGMSYRKGDVKLYVQADYHEFRSAVRQETWNCVGRVACCIQRGVAATREPSKHHVQAINMRRGQLEEVRRGRGQRH